MAYPNQPLTMELRELWAYTPNHYLDISMSQRIQPLPFFKSEYNSQFMNNTVYNTLI